jgi:hypothetical protein
MGRSRLSGVLLSQAAAVGIPFVLERLPRLVGYPPKEDVTEHLLPVSRHLFAVTLFSFSCFDNRGVVWHTHTHTHTHTVVFLFFRRNLPYRLPRILKYF